MMMMMIWIKIKSGLRQRLEVAGARGGLPWRVERCNDLMLLNQVYFFPLFKINS